MSNKTNFAAGRFERKPDLVTRSGGVLLSPMTNNKARILRDAVEIVKANPPKTRKDWTCFNAGIDSIFAEHMEIFVDPEKFASQTELKDAYDEARRKLANWLIEQPSAFRKSLVSKYSEMRALKAKEQTEKMCDALFLGKQDEMLQILESTAKNARIAAARRKAELDAEATEEANEEVKPKEGNERDRVIKLGYEIYNDPATNPAKEEQKKRKYSYAKIVNYILDESIPPTDKFYHRCVEAREIVAQLAKGGDTAAIRHSLTTQIKQYAVKTNPKKKKPTLTKSKERMITPTIGDSSSRYKGW